MLLISIIFAQFYYQFNSFFTFSFHSLSYFSLSSISSPLATFKARRSFWFYNIIVPIFLLNSEKMRFAFLIIKSAVWTSTRFSATAMLSSLIALLDRFGLNDESKRVPVGIQLYIWFWRDAVKATLETGNKAGGSNLLNVNYFPVA